MRPRDSTSQRGRLCAIISISNLAIVDISIYLEVAKSQMPSKSDMQIVQWKVGFPSGEDAFAKTTLFMMNRDSLTW